MKHLLERILYSFMKKVVISGSSKLQEKLITWKEYFEQKGYEVKLCAFQEEVVTQLVEDIVIKL